MSVLAVQTMDLALARFPAALLPDGGAGTLRRAAPAVAADVVVYFECRLAGSDRAVDVSQHFFAADGGAGRLLALARRQSGPAWSRLAAFAGAWAEDPALAAITEIGLEHDEGVAAPAVFAAFDGTVLDGIAAGERFVAAMAPEGLEGWRTLVSTLEIAVAHGLTPGRMVGVMLSRDAQLRCMIRDLETDRVRRFLAEAGWPGDIDRLADLMGRGPLVGDATRLVLGFTPALAPDVGFEVIHPRDEAGEAAQSALLDWLAGTGLAEPARVEAAAGWRGAVTPMDRALPWPETLISRDLATARGRLDAFSAFISHVKLNLKDGAPLPAKAYLALAPVRSPELTAHA